MSESPANSQDSLAGHIEQNIESILALRRREEEAATPWQRRVERVSRFIGRPVYLLGLLGGIAAWVIFNGTARWWGLRPFDAPPFELLDGIISLVALVNTTIVLIAQNRQVRVEQQHTHLDLQVNLLTEQKVTKLIHLIEELRRDLPNVRNRYDPQAAALQERADTAHVLSVIEEVGLARDPETPKGGEPERR